MATVIVSSSIKLATHASQLAVVILIIQERLLTQCDRPGSVWAQERRAIGYDSKNT